MIEGRNMGERRLLGITGTIGSGKTAVLRILEDIGWRTLNCDEIVNKLYTQERVVAFVRERFPQAVRGDRVDKKALAEIVFRDESKLKLLESLVHPFVREEILRFKRKGCGKVAVEVFLLFEVGWFDLFDGILLVDAPLEVRLRRVIGRGWNLEELRRRERRLMPLKEKVFLCRRMGLRCALLWNDSDIEVLRERVAKALRGMGF